MNALRPLLTRWFRMARHIVRFARTADPAHSYEYEHYWHMPIRNDAEWARSERSTRRL